MPTIVCRCFRVCQWASSLRYRTASTPRPRTRRRSKGSGGSPIATSASRPARSPASGFSTSTARSARRVLRALEAEHGKLPATWISSTGRGWHVWLRYTAPDPVEHRPHRSQPRCEGGWRLCGRAADRSIPSGRAYAWVVPPEGRACRSAGLACRPGAQEAGTVDLGTRAREHPSATMASLTAATAPPRSIARLQNSPPPLPGSRNAALNRCAFRLFQLVAGGELDGRNVADRLVEACHRNGLVKDDGLRAVVATIRVWLQSRPAASALAIGCRMTAPELRPYQRDVIAAVSRRGRRRKASRHPRGADRQRAKP